MKEGLGSESSRPNKAASGENLSLLYQGILTGIVRIQAGRQEVGSQDAFRRRIKATLAEIARDAAALDYRSEDITDASFAVVAFLDEAILSSSDPGRMQWAKTSLQEELFGQANAGQESYERLERLMTRRDSPQLADVLEVFYLCLLLGYQGRYAAAGRQGELRLTLDTARERIERIRGRDRVLSPDFELPRSAPPQAAMRSPIETIRIIALVCVALALVSFLSFKVHLELRGGDVAREMASGGQLR